MRRPRQPRARDVIAGAAAAAAAAELEEALATETSTDVAAFFDIDNTIMRGASIFHLARGLARRDFFSARDIARFTWQQVSFVVGGSENTGHMSQAIEAALGFVAGHSVEELSGLIEEIYHESMEEKIWPGTRAIAQNHLNAGERVWLVSAAPIELAGLLASQLGLSGALGTVSETIDGVYTGRLVGSPLHGPAKVEAVRALAGREGLDLARCFAYSDSANDIPLLEMVGHPTAVNPDSRLSAHAKAHGWKIRDFRTGRKAARIGIPAAAALGAAGGAAAAGIALHRSRRTALTRLLDRL